MSKTVRLFISSPGDVLEERERARQVIEGLRRRYAGRLDLKPVFWEDLPLQADASFQQGIDLVLSQDQGIDIAIFILWSRLGSPLGALIRKADGSAYRSGTEREFDLMLQARQQTGGQRPAFLVYTRRDEASFEERLRGTATGTKQDLIQQKQLVEQFIQEEFHDLTSGHNLRAYHSFDRPQTFSQRLRTHLRELLDPIAGEDLTEAIWDIEKQGPPFMGLDAFGAAQADVFFGREDEVLEGRRALAQHAREGCAFLLLTGASGSGKSSLARAGLLPAIAEHELDDTVAEWRSLVITPSELGQSDPIASLVTRLAEPGLLPELRAEGLPLGEIVTSLKKDPATTVSLVFRRAIAEASKARRGGVRCLLLVDQLEELFVLPEGEALLQVLEALARSGVFWIVATVRGDFMGEVHRSPGMARLLEGRQVLTVLSPDADALRRMIEEPARLAGLHFEQRGERYLSDQILTDAARHADLLPLVEFVLLRLHDRRTASGMLSWSVYETELGGVEGALKKRAEEVFESLPPPVQASLPQVLKHLITLGETTSGADDGTERLIRQRTALSTFPSGTPARQFVEAFIQQRLFTASQPTSPNHTDDHAAPQTTPPSETGLVTVAHEALLRVWPRATTWAEGSRDLLRTRARVAARMAEASPITEGDPLLDLARLHLTSDPEAFTPVQRTFIETSLQQAQANQQKRERLRRRVLLGLTTLTLLAIAGALFGLRATRQANAHAQTARQETQRAESALAESQTRLEYSQLEEGRAWLERARTALVEGDHLKALMLAGRSVGFVGFGRRSDESAAISQKYPLLLGETFSNSQAEQLRQEEVRSVHQFVNGITPVAFPAWSTPSQAYHQGSVTGVAISSDGSRLASSSSDKTVKIWETDSGKLLLTLKGHTDHVWTVALSPDGSLIASGADDKTVKIWDAVSGNLLSTLQGHTDNVMSVAFSPDGHRLASGSADGRWKIWNVERGEEISTLQTPMGFIACVSFSPDGRRIAAAQDRGVKIWDATNGKELIALSGHTDTVWGLAFSPDGTQIASGSVDDTVKIWNADSGQIIHTLEGHTEDVFRLCFSPDGRRIASASNDKTVKLWDVTSGKELRTLKGHTDAVVSIAFHPDNNRLISGSEDNTVKVWDTTQGIELTRPQTSIRFLAISPDGSRLATALNDTTIKLWDVVSGKDLFTLQGHPKQTTTPLSLAFSPDGTQLASVSDEKEVKIWRVVDGRLLTTITTHSEDVQCLAYSPDGRLLATGSWDSTVKIWEVPSGKQRSTLKGHTHLVSSVTFSPDGSRLASSSWDKTAKVWDVTNAKELYTLQGHLESLADVAFSPDGNQLASASDDHTVKIWDLTTGKERATLKGHKGAIDSVSFSPDGRSLATACTADGIIKVWDVDRCYERHSLLGETYQLRNMSFSSDWRQIIGIFDYETAMVLNVVHGREQNTLAGHTRSVLTVAFSPDGNQLVSRSEDETVKVWDATTGRELISLQDSHKVNQLIFSLDGSQIIGTSLEGLSVWDATNGRSLPPVATHSETVKNITISPDGSRYAIVTEDPAIKVKETSSGMELCTLHGAAQECLIFSQDGKRLASSSYDKTVKVWDIASGKLMTTLHGHTSNVNAMAFGPDGHHLASASADKTVKLWEIPSGKLLSTLHGHTNEVRSITFSPDGRQLASGSLDNNTKLWDADTGRELATLNGRVGGAVNLAFSPDGKRLASALLDDILKVWQLETVTIALASKQQASSVQIQAPRPLDLLSLDRQGYYSLEGKNVIRTINDSLYEPRSFQPLSPSGESLTPLTEADSQHQAYLLRLQQVSLPAQWRALLGIWNEAKQLHLTSDQRLRHEFCIQAAFAAKALLQKKSPEAPPELWNSLLSALSAEDWKDYRFSLPLAQALPLLLNHLTLTPDLAELLTARLPTLSPLPWLETVAITSSQSLQKAPPTEEPRRAHLSFYQSCLENHPDNIHLLRAAQKSCTVGTAEWQRLTDQLLIHPQLAMDDYIQLVASIAKKPGTQNLLARLVDQGDQRFDKQAAWNIAVGKAFIGHNRQQEALLRYDIANDINAWRELAKSLNDDTALHCWVKVTESDQATYEDFDLAGTKAAQLKKVDDCIRFYQAGIKKHAKRTGWFGYKCGLALIEMKQHEQALVFLEKATSNPEGLQVSSVFRALAECLTNLNRLEDAWKAWSKLLEEPEATSEQITMAGYFAALHNHRDAVSGILAKAETKATTASDLGIVHRMSGWIHINLALYPQALEAFMKAKSADDETTVDDTQNIDLLAGLSLAQWLNRQRDKAIETYKNLIEAGRSASESQDWSDTKTIAAQKWPDAETQPMEELRQATLAKHPDLIATPKTLPTETR